MLGVADATRRTSLVETLRVAFDLIACAVVRRQAVAADVLVALRGRAIVAFTALRAAAAAPGDALVAEHAAAAGAALEACFGVVVDVLADDRALEDDAGKETARALRDVVRRLREIADFSRLKDPGHVAAHAAKTLATASGRAAVEHAWTTLTTANPSAEPASPEARDVLRFFLDSFTDPQRARAAPAARAPSMVTLTPLYKEDVAFGAATLSARVDGENVSALRFLISMMPTEWAAMLQRCGLTLPGQDYEALLQTLHDEVAAAGSAREDDGAKAAELAEKKRLLREISEWASGRSQTMLRTARGMASYADATRVLARLEGVPEADIEPLVAVKYSHVVCAQVYGAEGNEENDEHLEQLLRENPHLSVVTAHREIRKVDDESAGFDDASATVWFATRRVADASGAVRQTHRVRLPGFPIVGEGKPENQNLGMAFATGLYLQTIDMNQFRQLAEALKMRNALAAFTGATRLVGFPEQVITDRSGSVASFAALSEQVFGTIIQRFLAKPLHVRFHVRAPRRVGPWVGAWAGRRLQGFAAAAPERGHLRRHEPDAARRPREVRGVHDGGQGREVSFDGTNQFNFKIASGNGMQLISRDFHRLAKRPDFFRSLHSPIQPGIFFAEFLLFASLAAFIVCKLMIAMLHVETFFGDGDAFDSVGFHEEVGLEMLYLSQWMIQASRRHGVAVHVRRLAGRRSREDVPALLRALLVRVAHLQHVHRQDARVRHRPHRAFRESHLQVHEARHEHALELRASVHHVRVRTSRRP